MHCIDPSTRRCSPFQITGGVNRAANAEAQVHSYADDGEAKVVANPHVNLPALLDLLQSKQEQPAHYEEHARAHEQLDVERGYRDPVLATLHASMQAPPPPPSSGGKQRKRKVEKQHKSCDTVRQKAPTLEQGTYTAREE